MSNEQNSGPIYDTDKAIVEDNFEQVMIDLFDAIDAAMNQPRKEV